MCARLHARVRAPGGPHRALLLLLLLNLQPSAEALDGRKGGEGEGWERRVRGAGGEEQEGD